MHSRGLLRNLDETRAESRNVNLRESLGILSHSGGCLAQEQRLSTFASDALVHNEYVYVGHRTKC